MSAGPWRTLINVGHSRARAAAVLAALACVALAAGACGGKGGSPARGAPVPAEESTSPAPPTTLATTTTVANYDIPATIDQAYVQRVVSAHDHALGDAIRVMVRDKAISDDFLK